MVLCMDDQRPGRVNRSRHKTQDEGMSAVNAYCVKYIRRYIQEYKTGTVHDSTRQKKKKRHKIKGEQKRWAIRALIGHGVDWVEEF